MNPGKSGQLPDCLADPVIVGCTGFRVPFAGKKAKRLELMQRDPRPTMIVELTTPKLSSPLN
jgi:hypothetical protein